MTPPPTKKKKKSNKNQTKKNKSTSKKSKSQNNTSNGADLTISDLDAMISAIPTSTSSTSSGSTSSTAESEVNDPHWYKGSGKWLEPASDPLKNETRGGNYKFEGKLGQTYPPTIPISQLYKKANKDFPEGEIFLYDATMNAAANTEEKRALDRQIYLPTVIQAREAAEVHRQVRQYAQTLIKPNVKLIDFCYSLENKVRELLPADGLLRGTGFPTGVSVNECAAHFTPNPGDTDVFGAKDIMSVDFGTHINGFIIDCAFSVAFDPMFDNLLAAAKDATNTGIKESGIGVRLCDVGEAIQEAMESYEVEINGELKQIRVVRNLNGHSIRPYNIHAGKSVPCVKGGPATKMEEGEFFAIETFGSTGNGYVHNAPNCSHYMKDFDARPTGLRSSSARKLLKHIDKNYSTLPFCHRWLRREGLTKYQIALKTLVDAEIIRDYPPLVDAPGSYTAQYEHTLILRPTCKEVLSRGDDF